MPFLVDAFLKCLRVDCNAHYMYGSIASCKSYSNYAISEEQDHIAQCQETGCSFVKKIKNYF